MAVLPAAGAGQGWGAAEEGEGKEEEGTRDEMRLLAVYYSCVQKRWRVERAVGSEQRATGLGSIWATFACN